MFVLPGWRHFKLKTRLSQQTQFHLYGQLFSLNEHNLLGTGFLSAAQGVAVRQMAFSKKDSARAQTRFASFLTFWIINIVT